MLFAGAAAARRRWGRSARILGVLAGFVGAYLAVVAVVSVVGQPRRLGIGQPRCYDDWCLSVEGVQRAAEGGSVAYTVELRLSSRARVRPQRENGVRVYVRDGGGRRYEPLADARAIPLNTLLQPGGSVTATRVFRLPGDATELALILAHGRFPGLFVIGDDESLLHGRSRWHLE